MKRKVIDYSPKLSIRQNAEANKISLVRVQRHAKKFYS